MLERQSKPTSLKDKIMVLVMYQSTKGIITKTRTSTKRIIRTHTMLSILINSRKLGTALKISIGKSCVKKLSRN